MKRLALIGAIPLVLTAVLPVYAVPQAGKENLTGDIYIDGLTSYQKILAEYATLPKVQSKQANECGLIKLTASSTSIPIAPGDQIKVNGGNAFIVSALPEEAAPRCSSGALTGVNLTPSSQLKTAEGDVYLTGLTPYTKHEVTFVSVPTVRSVSANTCGIARLSNSAQYANPTGTITVTDKETGAAIKTINTATITAVSGGPVCKNGQTFTTADWPN